MYKTTFGPRIHYVITLTLIFSTLSAWTSGELFAQISITEDSTTKATCPNSSDGAINISINGGTPNYNYEWEGPGTYSSISQDISGLIAGSYTVTVTDSSTPTSQSASKTINIEGHDSIIPTITAPADTQGNTDSNNCNTSDINLGTPTTNDNCGVASVTHDAPTNFPLGSTTVIWTVTDNSGNTATDTQKVIISDNTDPTITAPADIQADSDTDDCNASSVNLGTEIANDNCGIALVENDAPVNFPLGETIVTWTVTDNAGNTATDTQKVIISDNTNPTITAPADIQTDSDTDDCNASSVNLGTEIANDNCGIALVENDAPVNFPLGETIVTWTVKDNAGNTATDTQKVIISDNTNPTITAPADIQADSDTDDCNASSVNLGTEIANDNCGIALVENDAPVNFPLGETIVTWTVKDNAGNMATAIQVITISDNTKPIITAGNDIEATNDTGVCQAGLGIAPATATDNCNVGNPSGIRNDGLGLDEPYPVGTTTITWNVQDANGNEAEQVVQNVVVLDNESPEIPTIEDITWGCEYTVEAPVTVDNCSGEIIGTTTDPLTYSNTGTYTITWSFTDEYNNSSQATQTITIKELTLEIEKEDVLCNGFETGSINAIVTGGINPITYSWSNTNTNSSLGNSSSLSNLPAGNYAVTVTDVNGCELSENIEISQPQTISMEAPSSTPVSCFGGSDGTISAGTLEGGTAPYTYSLDNTNFQSSNSFSNLTSKEYTIFVKDNNECSFQIDISVEGPNELTANLTKTDVNCFEGADGTIQVNNSAGGNAGYEYSLDQVTWQANPEFTGLSAGTFSVYIRDNSVTDCEVHLQDITLNQPSAKLEVTTSSTRTSTFGTSTGSITANPTGGTAGYFYEWREISSTAIIGTTKTLNNLPAGTYEVIVRDSNGCLTDGETIIIIDAITAQIDSAAMCESTGDRKDDEQVRTAYFRVTDLTALGGDGNYTYFWEFGEGKTATGPGQHAVVYNNPGNKTIKLTVTDSSGASYTVTRQQYVGLCYEPCGQAQNFQFDVEGIYIGDIDGNELLENDLCTSGIDKYLFLPVSKNVNVYNPYTEVTFTTRGGGLGGILEDLLEAQEDFGCKDGEEIDEIFDKNKPNRVGDFIRLTIDPIEYECGDDLNIDSFYITYTNNSKKDCGSNNNGFCYSTNEPVTVPTPVFVVATPNHILCHGEETGFIEAKGTGGFAPYTFKIDPNAEFRNNNIFNNLPAGDHTIYIRDSRGNENSTTVTINQPDTPVTITVTKTDPECFGDNGIANAVASGGTPFSGTDPYEYLWNDVASNDTATPNNLSPGEYTVTVTDGNGCQAIETVIIEAPTKLTEPSAGEDQSLGCGSFSVSLSANTAEVGFGQWTIDTTNSPGGGEFEDDTDPTTIFTGTEGTNGTYTLVWTIANEEVSCFAEDTVQITMSGDCSELDFDGVDDHVLVGEAYGLTSNNFSFEIWVQTETLTGNQTIFSKRDKSNPNGGYDFTINNGNPTFKWSGKTLSSNYKLAANKWYHLAVIYEGGTARIYVDGLDAGNISSASNPATTTAPFIIGAQYDSSKPNDPVNFYNGWMEELRIWNKALTKSQLRFMMNQRVKINTGAGSADIIEGEIIPNKSIEGSYYTQNGLNLDENGKPFYNLIWSNLNGYYRLISNNPDPSGFNTFGNNELPADGLTPDFSLVSNPGKIQNIETNQENTSPLPFISTNSNASSNWDEQVTWFRPNVWNIPNATGAGNNRINWNIVQLRKDITADRDISLLGLISTSNEFKLNGSVSNENGQGLTVSHYLKLDGNINLEGNSQLVQPEGSILAESSSGYIDIDQQGTANSFNYNYWTSPVSLTNSANNSGYTIDSVLMDGSDPDEPQQISFNYNYTWADGNYSGNKRISSYWLYTFKGTANDYSEWHQFGESEALEAGIGFSMKGTTGYVPVRNRQNYTFRGKPNNGDINVSIGASGQNLLTGNPYPSAIDALEFIGDNLDGFNGSLYFWDHFGAVNSHYLEEYVGGYAVYNLSGGIASASSVDSRINPTGEKSSKAPPGRYIPVGQAFFISSTGVSSPTEITYKNKYRAFVPESTNDSQFHSQEKANPKKGQEQYKKDSRYKIRLKFESPKGYHRQILVTADANSSSGFDLGYDAPLFENNVEDMYWMIDSTEFVIQAVPDFNLDQVLPLGIKISEEGAYTIKIDELENIEKGFDIYLKDKLNDTYFDLTKEDYTATAEELGSFNDRYEIVFKTKEEENPDEDEDEEEEEDSEGDTDEDNPVDEKPGINDPNIGLDDAILELDYLKATDEISLFNPELMNVDYVELYSISGQKIMTFWDVPTQEAVLLKINQKLSSAVYILKLYSGEKSRTKKIIITK